MPDPTDTTDVTDDAARDVDTTDTGTGSVDDTTTVDSTDTTTTTAGQDKPKATIKGDFDPDRFARTLDRVRGEAKAEKEARLAAEAKADGILKALQKALGQETDTKPDPDALTRQLEEARAAEALRRTENLVLRVAPGLGADPDVLLDSQAFCKRIAEYGPDARDDIEDTVRDFLTKSPRFKLTTVKPADTTTGTDGDTKTTPKPTAKPAGRSGSDMAGAGAKPRQITSAELAKMTPREIVAAREKGLLDDLLGG